MESDNLSDAFIDEYLPHFEGIDMSLEQKREYIKALSKIMKTDPPPIIESIPRVTLG